MKEEEGLGSRNAGTETGDSQVGEWLCVVGGDAGTNTGDAQVGGRNRVVDTVGTRASGAAG